MMKHSFKLTNQKSRVRFPNLFMILIVILTATLIAACGGSSAEGLAVGESAPAFTLPSASGDNVSLSDYHGSKPVLLYFHMADG